MPQIRLQNLHRTFDGGLIALDGIDLSIESGEFVAILGPSGSGKSTMLRIIAGLDRPTAGSAQVGNPGEKPQLAYVFQDAHLLPWRNVRRNVELPLELMGVSRPKRRDAAIEALASVGLADAARRYPNQLSGGMRMRVSIARAMVAEPKILLMDEPFAALDEITRHQLDDQLRQLWESRKITIIFVTHSTMEAIFLAERAVVLSARPARIVADRKVELPPHRTGELRSTAEFARQTGFVFEALKRADRSRAAAEA